MINCLMVLPFYNPFFGPLSGGLFVIGFAAGM